MNLEAAPAPATPARASRSASRQASAELRRAGRAPSTAGASTATTTGGNKSKRSVRSVFSFLFCCTSGSSGSRRHHGKDGRYRAGVGASGAGIDGNLHPMSDKAGANGTMLHPTAGVGANPITQQIVLSPDKELVAAAQAVVAAGSNPTGVPTDGAATPSEMSATKVSWVQGCVCVWRKRRYGKFDVQCGGIIIIVETDI